MFLQQQAVGNLHVSSDRVRRCMRDAINYRQIFEDSFQRFLVPLGAEEDTVQKGERDDNYRGWWKVCLSVPVDVPPMSGFPSNVSLSVYIHPLFPFYDYAVFPDDKEIRGFPHQDSETGKLCLWSDHRLGHSEKRLWNIVRSARLWLNRAADGSLAAADDEYELPDFSRRYYPKDTPRILFNENESTFKIWCQLLNSSGLCTIGAITQDIKLLCIKDFKTHDGQVLVVYEWGDKI